MHLNTVKSLILNNFIYSCYFCEFKEYYYCFGYLQQDEPSLEDENAQSLPQRTGVRSFIKTLTSSDTSTHGGFSVPKRHAADFFPNLVSVLVKNLYLNYLF